VLRLWAKPLLHGDGGAKSATKPEKLAWNAVSRREAKTEARAYFIAIFLIMAITSLRSLSFRFAE
jgi:hypothetical protein